MTAVVAIVAPGNMGAALARRLVEQEFQVITSLEGRGPASVARAREAGMKDVSRAELCGAEFVLSILPPAAALSFAQSMASLLQAARRKPVFVDCNAVSPQTVQEIAAVIEATGAPFVDAAIIGLAPKPGGASPHLYVAGSDAHRLKTLNALDVRVLDGPVGAASALKMCYAGINKGLAAIGAAMLLAATRAGATAALHQEMSESLPNILSSLGRQIPDMLPKSYRWGAEMREIAAFGGGTGSATGKIFEGFGELFDQIAMDVAGEQIDSEALRGFFKR
jgi:3-hydroxyisobutyrate dehydrogenase-like beta-hydroxyacid dehydrogenase